MRFAFIARHRRIWPVNWLCEFPEVSHSGLHAWLNRPFSDRTILYAKLVAAIDMSFKASDRTYDARCVWHDVLDEGLICRLHRIERLIRQDALKARPRRYGKPGDDGARSVITYNILDRNFEADRPNQRLLADFTYLWTAQVWLYVAVLLDLFSRRVMSWSMSAEREAMVRFKVELTLHRSEGTSGWQVKGLAQATSRPRSACGHVNT